jgi:nucleoside 2-deoxyribosyltransferase
VSNYRKKKYDSSYTFYHCPVCGEIRLTEEAVNNYKSWNFSKRDDRIISCVLRNEYQKRGNKPPDRPIDIDYPHRVVDQYVPLTPLEKLDYALQRVNSLSQKIGDQVQINVIHDYTLFHCLYRDELHTVLTFLESQELVSLGANEDGITAFIQPKGYERLIQIQQARQDSTTCFVAMWFSPEVQTVYDQAIKTAIEFIEEGQTESRFKAVKIDDVEHINDINDEIIATIRRSRFMVCDLTGYRGGVYFEAGFAYGLGLPVIYTCRKDWSSEDKLRDKDGNVIETLKDGSGREIRVKKEGVHFDLAHRNRIEWEENKLGEFRKALENRIKAVIV